MMNNSGEISLPRELKKIFFKRLEELLFMPHSHNNICPHTYLQGRRAGLSKQTHLNHKSH
jgi:hypothetical protein